MNRNRKKKNRKKETGAVVSLLLASSLAFGGCGTAVTSSSSVNAESARTESTGETSADNADTTSESTDSENAMESASDINFDLELTESTIDTEFTDREKSGSYKALEAVKITLNKTTATVSGSGAKADGSTITITEEGVYVVSGTLEDGQIIVDASDSDKVQIVLDGVHINCETNAAIYVREADKVFITLAENSSNTLGGGNEYTQIDDNTVDGVIFSKSDLVCNGTGSLTIEADYKHGIVSKDDLVITGGTYKIATADNGITAKDQIKILDGSFDIDAANSAVKAKNTDDTELGNIYIAGGIFTIEAEQDGFHATGSIVVDDGTITVNSGDDGSAIVTGGTLAAICSAGMTESFDEASTQPVITYYSTETQSADTTITLTDSDGSALFTVTPEKAYASIVLTCPEMKLDATYTLAAGTDNEEIILTDIITTAGTRSVKTMSDPEGGKMPNNSDNKGTPPSKPSDTAE